MPYAPGIQYRGDVSLARGIASLGEGLSGAIQNFRKDKEESEFLDAQLVGLAQVARPLAEAQELDPKLIEDLGKFAGQSLSKKRALAANALFQVNRADRMRKEKVETEDRNLRRELERGRVVMEAGRENRALRGEAGLARFSRGVADWTGTPEMLRRDPLERPEDARLRLAAESGILTPEMGIDLARIAAANPPEFEPESRVVDGVRMMRTGRGTWQQAYDREAAQEARFLETRLARLVSRRDALQNQEGNLNFDQSAPAKAERATRIAEYDRQIEALESIGNFQDAAPAGAKVRPNAELKPSAGSSELDNARTAIKAGVPRERVARMYKERTGQDLPAE